VRGVLQVRRILYFYYGQRYFTRERLTTNQMQEETLSFEAFDDLGKTQPPIPAKIDKEIEWLGEIKDVLDELNTMTVLYNDQKRILKQFDDIMRRRQSQRGMSNPHGRGFEGRPSAEIRDSVGNGSKIRAEERQSRNEFTANDQIRPIWGSRTDPEDFSLPIALVNASISDVEGMTQRAQKAYQAVGGTYFHSKPLL
jgi:hypothetical protein